MSRTRFGIEVLQDKSYACLRSRRIGLLANQASVDADFRYTWQRFQQAGLDLVAMFTPQHGLWGEQQANMIESNHDQLGAIPVYSLYSDVRSPTREMLDNLDVLVIDLQDVGTRVYTFAWTMTLCMQQCARRQVPVVILDRPNPLGGEIWEGRRLQKSFESFVGLAAIPMRHALTLGELANYLKAYFCLDLDLTVVPMQGWTASEGYPRQRTWIGPSPNLPRHEGVLLYPGMVLLEGTNLSEGRGTTVPFECIGAPFVDSNSLLESIPVEKLTGLAVRRIRFRPTFDKWEGKTCHGLAWHPCATDNVRSFALAVHVLAAAAKLWPTQFRFLDPPYEYETKKHPIDIIYGSSALREQFLTGNPVVEELAGDELDWPSEVAPYLLYPRQA